MIGIIKNLLHKIQLAQLPNPAVFSRYDFSKSYWGHAIHGLDSPIPNKYKPGAAAFRILGHGSAFAGQIIGAAGGKKLNHPWDRVHHIKPGDEIVISYQSGPVAFKVESIKYMDDPKDMFEARIHATHYLNMPENVPAEKVVAL